VAPRGSFSPFVPADFRGSVLKKGDRHRLVVNFVLNIHRYRSQSAVFNSLRLAASMQEIAI